MNIIIHPCKLSGSIKAIPSKSYAHRMIICAALSDKPSKIHIEMVSKDIEATLNCVKGLGAKITRESNIYTVFPIKFDKNDNPPFVDCGESGSTLRFITPILSAIGGGKIKTHGRLPQRPMNHLTECLEKNGVSVFKKDDIYEISGKLKGNYFEIAGNVSSQYISGLLLMLPLIGGGKIELTTSLSSASYVDITIDVMKKFGVDVDFENNIFTVKNTKYRANDVFVPGDWSNGSFWLTSGINVENLDINSLQGDKSILNVISNMGCDVVYNEENIRIEGNISKDSIIDVDNIPDAVPTLSVFAAKSGCKTTFINALRLKDKESDRISSCLNMLKNLGVDAYERGDGFELTGIGDNLFKQCVIDCAGDHRIAMACATACDRLSGDIKLIGAECVEKSYPGFWDDFVSLGGKTDVEYNR